MIGLHRFLQMDNTSMVLDWIELDVYLCMSWFV